VAAIIGALIAIALVTTGAYSAVQQVTGQGRAAMDRIRNANQKRTGNGTKAKAADSKSKPGNTASQNDPAHTAVDPAGWAIRSGAGISALLHAAGLTARAGRAGWGVGWELGRNKAYDWWQRRRARPQRQQTTESADDGRPDSTGPGRGADTTAHGQTPHSPTGCSSPHPHGAHDYLDGNSERRHCPGITRGPGCQNTAPHFAHTYTYLGHADWCRGVRDTDNRVIPIRPKGTTKMPVNTATGGEVVDIDTALAEAKAMLKEAQTELDDAAADKARALEDASRVERYAISFGALDFPQRGKDLANALAQSNGDRKAAAEKRHTAAESRQNEAMALVTYLEKHKQIQEMGAEVGGMAGKAAYSN
jgi:hypothetical protein